MTRTRSTPATSPDDLLKAAVAGKAETKPEADAAPPASGTARFRAMAAGLRGEGRLLGTAGAALALGAALGAGLAVSSGPRGTPTDPVAGLSAIIDAGRIETTRLGAEIAKLHQALADLRGAGEDARKDAAARGTALAERVAQGERAVVGKVVALGERFEQVEREQSARVATLSAQLDRRPATPVAVTRSEPAQTGSLAEARTVEPKSAELKSGEPKGVETKPVETKAADPKQTATGEKSATEKSIAAKPPVLDGWALRDVYDGAAILESRRRRIVEVGPGDTLPGIGRVDAVERRGHEWVVVTRQGIVTAQPW